MFNFHKNHRQLIITIFLVFGVLSFGIAILPAYQMQENNAPLPSMEPMTDAELEGLKIFISEGCVACHTQQVRNIEMDNMWGDRPSMPSDYYYSKKRLDIWRQSPSLLGSERTGPDLTNVGKRQPGDQWHLLHLYNPRIVVEESIMPAYPWLFNHTEKPHKDAITLEIPDKYKKGKGQVVASEKALQLVAYLKSLKQAPVMPEQAENFIPAKPKKSVAASTGGEAALPDGGQLYQTTCMACHQSNGKGIPGAFPPLAGSKVVNDKDPELMIRIILQGYDAHPEYAQMPGFADMLSDEEIAAIANHERTSWGNTGTTVSAQEVAEIRALVEKLNL